MRVAVFTSNQPRHTALLERLATTADEVVAVLETTTVFPGEVDDFYRRSPPMQAYFSRVMQAEAQVFGTPRFLPPNVRSLSLKLGDLSRLDLRALQPALSCDAIVVFGASYIKAPLVDELVARRALNIHMGVSPYYRGSGCNFWAVHDGNADLVGATIHLLSAGLDSGDILFHALPPAGIADPFELGMRAVESAHIALTQALASGTIASMAAIPQDKSAEIRYSRYSDFTDEVVAHYLANPPQPDAITQALRQPPRPGIRLTAGARRASSQH